VTTWHAPAEALARFATSPETLDEATASSLEAHLLGCAACRQAVAAAAGPAPLAASWAGVADRVDRPHRTLGERLLGRLLPEDVARVVAATPALRLSWLAGVVAVVAAVVVVARQTGTSTPFLALAPLVPLAGVAVAFGQGPDPAGEAALASPLYGAGLLLRRTAAVLATSLLVLAAGSLALPGLELRAVAWVLPALGLAFGALALSTWVSPLAATTVAAGAWLVALQVSVLSSGPTDSVGDSGLFGPVGQLTFAALAALAVAGVTTRRAQFVNPEVR